MYLLYTLSFKKVNKRHCSTMRANCVLTRSFCAINFLKMLKPACKRISALQTTTYLVLIRLIMEIGVSLLASVFYLTFFVVLSFNYFNCFLFVWKYANAEKKTLSTSSFECERLMFVFIVYNRIGLSLSNKIISECRQWIFVIVPCYSCYADRIAKI